MGPSMAAVEESKKPKEANAEDAEASSVSASNIPMTFMKLPPHLRLQIYLLSGLIRSCPIVIDRKSKRTKREMDYFCPPPTGVRLEGYWLHKFHSQDCSHPRLPVNLFRVSEAVSEDAKQAFFTHNWFHLSIQNANCVNTFKKTPSLILKSIQSLRVTLTSPDEQNPKASPSVRLKSWELRLKSWEQVCSFAASALSGLKHFSFSCGVADEDTAKEIIVRMGDHFHDLLHCSLRIDSGSFSPIMKHLIKEKADQMLMISSHVPEFPFMQLPKEIQKIVLGHLLIVQWDPCVDTNKAADGQIVLLKQRTYTLHCCGSCSPSGLLCFCSQKQIAFSTSCRCFSNYRMHLPVFLVNKYMHNICNDIFYSRNRFTFIHEDPRTMSRFLTQFPRSYLRMIRQMTVKLPNNHYGSLLGWAELADAMAKVLDLESLSLTFVDLGYEVRAFTVTSRTECLKNIMGNFCKLTGRVRDFKVYLQDMRDHEIVCERQVMGPDYNVGAKTKFVPFVGEVDIISPDRLFT